MSRVPGARKRRVFTTVGELRVCVEDHLTRAVQPHGLVHDAATGSWRGPDPDRPGPVLVARFSTVRESYGYETPLPLFCCDLDVGPVPDAGNASADLPVASGVVLAGLPIAASMTTGEYAELLSVVRSLLGEWGYLPGYFVGETAFEGHVRVLTSVRALHFPLRAAAEVEGWVAMIAPALGRGLRQAAALAQTVRPPA